MRVKENQFEKENQIFKADLQRFRSSKRRTDDWLRSLEKQLKELNKVISEMQNLYNKSKDKRSSIIKFQEEFANLARKLEQASVEYNDFKLYGMEAAQMKTHLSNQDMMKDNLAGFGGVKRDVIEIDDNINNAGQQLINDNETLGKIDQDRKDINDYADDSNKLLKRQRNQELVKRLMLIGLAAFLTVSDLILLVLKIT